MSFSDQESIYSESTESSERNSYNAPSSSNKRRLPAVPRARPTSRPLPPIPRPLWCKQCRSSITSMNHLLPLSAIPEESRAFRGFSGKASLFTEIQHAAFSKPAVQLMATGAHTMAEITCSHCSTYLGWHIIKAHEASEKWKEGKFLLELENLFATTNIPLTPRGTHLDPGQLLLESDSEDSS
ncbi:hypothetical protein C8J56DRAFT_1169957 [Mycena floridula]|nr:hypothetical protein C8J56DRAFT_1169957 [Mycena floridula]